MLMMTMIIIMAMLIVDDNEEKATRLSLSLQTPLIQLGGPGLSLRELPRSRTVEIQILNTAKIIFRANQNIII